MNERTQIQARPNLASSFAPIRPGLSRKPNGARAETQSERLTPGPGESSPGHSFDQIPVYPVAPAEAPPGHAPLPEGLRKRLGSAAGVDLSSVRVHDSPLAHALADRLGARAFTAGRDIYFGRGAYAPDTREGVHLLAHEVVHVAQEGATSGGVSAKPEVVDAADPRERDADAFAAAFVSGMPQPRIAAAPHSGHVYRKLKVGGDEVSEGDEALTLFRASLIYAEPDESNLDRLLKSSQLFMFDTWHDLAYQLDAMREQEKAATEVERSVGFAHLGETGGVAERSLDPTYWKLSKDGQYYEATGKDYASAIRAALTGPKQNKLECAPQTDLMQLYAVLLALGDRRFNAVLGRRLKALGARLTIPLHFGGLSESTTLEFSDPARLDDLSQLVPGDRVIFNAWEAFADAREKGQTIIYGQWKVENAVVVEFDEATDEPLFVGGGVPGKKTRYEMQKYICERIFELNPKVFRAYAMDPVKFPPPPERIEKVVITPEVSRLPLLWRSR